MKIKIKTTLALTAVSLAVVAPIHAKDSTSKKASLEVIEVTAQKRIEDAQKTPISMQVINADDLVEQSIEKIDDLQYSTPNLMMTETGISTQLFIRGIGTGNNQGFEQSVGQYVDGVYYGRQQLLRAPFLDLQQIEVLKGPQSIMFGKNSVAGALSLTTAKPSDDLEAHLGVQYQSDFGAWEYNAMLSGGLTDTLSARLALRNYDEEGYIHNDFRNRDETAREETAARLSLLWQPNDNANVLFKTEKDKFNGVGRQVEMIRDDPALDTAPIPGATFSQILAVLGHPQAISDSDQDLVRQADARESSSNNLSNTTITANVEFSDFTLTSVSGWISYDFAEYCDCDYTAAPVFSVTLDEDYSQFSQEIRLTSKLGEQFDWIAGLFYQTSDQVMNDNILVPTNSVLGLLSAGALLPVTGKGAGRQYTLDTDIWSAFVQTRFHFDEKSTLTLGGRFSSEDKSATRVMNITELDTGAITTDTQGPILFNVAFGIQNQQSALSPNGHNLNGQRDESSFTPLLNYRYKVDDNLMLYASATTGFKAGGFDARANNVDSWEFIEEDATAFEAGLKSRLLDNTLEFNFSVYRTEYDNLQISQFDGVLGFNVGNAKETRVQGFELDGRWLANDNLSVRYAMAYLDHEFKDFTNGNCYNRQIPDGDMGAGGNQLCDYTGKSGQYTPELSANISFDHVSEVSFGPFEYFTASLGLYYSAEQNVEVNLNPLYEIDAYTKVNLRFALEGQHWNLALFAKNITDQQLTTYVGNAPLSGSTFGTNTFYAFVDRPRSIALQLNYYF